MFGGVFVWGRGGLGVVGLGFLFGGGGFMMFFSLVFCCFFVFYINGRKEGNILFNDALNTFYLRLYGVRHMVKDHSDNERKPAAAT